MAPINKNKERSSAWVFSESIAYQTVEPVKAFAHVAGLQGHEDLQAPAKAQHPLVPSRPSLSINTAARPAWAPFVISRWAPPGKCTRNLAPVGDSCPSPSTIVSNHRTGTVLLVFIAQL